MSSVRPGFGGVTASDVDISPTAVRLFHRTHYGDALPFVFSYTSKLNDELSYRQPPYLS